MALKLAFTSFASAGVPFENVYGMFSVEAQAARGIATVTAARAPASHGDDSVLRFCAEQAQAWADEPVLPAPLLRGRDLLELGYPEGPRIGEILGWVRDAQLEDELRTPEEAVRRVRDRYPLPPRED